VSKNIEKLIKLKKLKKKKLKKSNREKKPIRILKRLSDSVWFQFYKLETEKTEPNPNRKKKPSKTGKN
jgi:hypothetical protein